MKLTIVLVSTLALVASVIAAPITTSGLAAQLATGPADVILKFASTTSTLNSVRSLTFDTRGARITATRGLLISFAEKSQNNVLNFLNSKSIESTQFWISNELLIKNADAKLVAELNQFPEIEVIRENRLHEVPKLERDFNSVRDNSVLAEWGIESIQAHLVWTLPGGGNGQGVRVSSIDTGVHYTHESLRANYYGTYGWFDPYDGSSTPIDENGHGTHTMGTICGSGGIGVAPGAQWISCRGCDFQFCADDALLRCAQFILCPTLANGTQPNCNHAPDIVSNSWGGGQGDEWYDSSIRAWDEVGIITVFANGNSGSACGSANSPADTSAKVFAVGSTTDANGLSSFSSRGPSLYGTLKPDISAPGSNVRSAYHTANNAYTTMSGTSMACPHVAGVVALLKGIDRNLRFERAASLIHANADRNLVPTGQNCGAINDNIYPNHSFGYGKINALRAAQELLNGS